MNADFHSYEGKYRRPAKKWTGTRALKSLFSPVPAGFLRPPRYFRNGRRRYAKEPTIYDRLSTAIMKLVFIKCKKPVIAAINGACVGAGFSACFELRLSELPQTPPKSVRPYAKTGRCARIGNDLLAA